MKIRVTLIMFLSFLAVYVNAVPARKQVFYMQQPDGSYCDIMLVGDEHYHFYTTIDGIPVIKNMNGGIYYPIIKDDELVCSPILAHNPTARTVRENNYIDEHNEAIHNYIIEKWSTNKNDWLVKKN